MRFLATFIFLAISSVLTYGDDEIYVSTEFGFLTIFPDSPEAIPVENSLGDALVVTAGVVEEDTPKVLLYQVITHRVDSMAQMPKFDEETVYSLTTNNLKQFILKGRGTNFSSSRSKISKWPAIEFFCEHNDFFRDGIISYKRGYAFLNGDTYYKVIVHSLENNDELKSEALEFFAAFSFIDPETIKKLENK